MNTVTYFFIGYFFFLLLMFGYLRRLDKKQEEIQKLLEELNK